MSQFEAQLWDVIHSTYFYVTLVGVFIPSTYSYVILVKGYVIPSICLYVTLPNEYTTDRDRFGYH